MRRPLHSQVHDVISLQYCRMPGRIELIDSLARMASEAILPLADPSAGFALLDFPDYPNVGDSLIWLGQLAFFDRYAGRPAYVCTKHQFDTGRLRRALPEGPIYLSGGGNFGDLWPYYQEFRIKVLEAFPDRSIIQLPQTIHFEDSANVATTRNAIVRHGKFAMMVRDKTSLSFAQAAFDCPVLLAPDMAFQIGAVATYSPPSHDLLLLLRTDKERLKTAGMLHLDGFTALTTDWIEEPTFTRAARIREAAVQRLISTEARYRRQARGQLARGIGILQQGRGVVTDRLHGHILGLLLGLPQIVLDNNYGKISSFVREWTAGQEDVLIAKDLSEASASLERLRSLLN